MKVELTPRLLILAAAIAGFSACDNAGKRVQEEKQDIAQEQQEAEKARAELAREQREERADLNRKTQNEVAEEHKDLAQAERGQGAPLQNDPARERNDVDRELAARGEKVDTLQDKQAKERAELAKDQQEERVEQRKDLAEARRDLNEERAEIVKDSREELRDLDQRAEKLRQKTETASPETKTQVTTALSGFPTERKAVERDIDALNTVQEANLRRAQDKVKKELSGLDKRLDRAESYN
jgi:DNA repair exonuclease SbcCD ATPase subunit